MFLKIDKEDAGHGPRRPKRRHCNNRGHSPQRASNEQEVQRIRRNSANDEPQRSTRRFSSSSINCWLVVITRLLPRYWVLARTSRIKSLPISVLLSSSAPPTTVPMPFSPGPPSMGKPVLMPAAYRFSLSLRDRWDWRSVPVVAVQDRV